MPCSPVGRSSGRGPALRSRSSSAAAPPGPAPQKAPSSPRDGRSNPLHETDELLRGVALRFDEQPRSCSAKRCSSRASRMPRRRSPSSGRRAAGASSTRPSAPRHGAAPPRSTIAPDAQHPAGWSSRDPSHRAGSTPARTPNNPPPPPPAAAPTQTPSAPPHTSPAPDHPTPRQTPRPPQHGPRAAAGEAPPTPSR
jgi:hypothetical protein